MQGSARSRGYFRNAGSTLPHALQAKCRRRSDIPRGAKRLTSTRALRAQPSPPRRELLALMVAVQEVMKRETLRLPAQRLLPEEPATVPPEQTKLLLLPEPQSPRRQMR